MAVDRDERARINRGNSFGMAWHGMVWHEIQVVFPFHRSRTDIRLVNLSLDLFFNQCNLIKIVALKNVTLNWFCHLCNFRKYFRWMRVNTWLTKSNKMKMHTYTHTHRDTYTLGVDVVFVKHGTYTKKNCKHDNATHGTVLSLAIFVISCFSLRLWSLIMSTTQNPFQPKTQLKNKTKPDGNRTIKNRIAQRENETKRKQKTTTHSWSKNY